MRENKNCHANGQESLEKIFRIIFGFTIIENFTTKYFG